MTTILESMYPFPGVQDGHTHFSRTQVLTFPSDVSSAGTQVLSQRAWSSPQATCSAGGGGLRAQGFDPKRGLCI